MCSKVDNHLHEKTLFSLYSLKKFAQIEFSVKSLTLSCLISALNLYFAQKLLRKAKKLLEVARTSKSCLHNRDRPRHCFVGFCNFWRPKLGLVH